MNQNGTGNTGLDFHLSALAVLVCLCVGSAFSQTTCSLGAKIQPALCAHLDSVTADQLIPVNITMYEPVIHVPICEDRYNPPPVGVNCGQLSLDSEAAYWNRQKGEWIRTFSECPVWDTATLSHRLDSTDFKVTTFYSGLATKQTIITLATESLVRMLDLGFYLRLSDSMLHATSFPFDTLLVGCFTMNDSGLVRYNNSEIMISRYKLPLFFWRTPDPLWFPEHFSWDFETNLNENKNLIKYPAYDYFTNDFKFLITSCECHGMPSCSSWLKLDTTGYKNFEYRIRTVSSFLYMKVLDGSTPDSIKLRFNTSSFLPPDAVRRRDVTRRSQSLAPELGRRVSKGQLRSLSLAEGSTVNFFSINGQNITTDVMNGNYFPKTGVVFVKITENGRSYYLKKVLAR